ncbi:protein MANBAL [Cimex lectularius]|uniref:Protein anon-73B1 n=1 Tax=Cimex lectularius TaxID=79782 RepID=A0A8I6SPR6_CIMLE|nr:protein MANBAL [Cimex lectularius]
MGIPPIQPTPTVQQTLFLLGWEGCKLDSNKKKNMVDLEIPPETTTEFLIRVGLYIGAIFQLTCILAIIILPDKNTNSPLSGSRNIDNSDQQQWESSSAPARHSHNRARKQDKKKRR